MVLSYYYCFNSDVKNLKHILKRSKVLQEQQLSKPVWLSTGFASCLLQGQGGPEGPKGGGRDGTSGTCCPSRGEWCRDCGLEEDRAARWQTGFD